MLKCHTNSNTLRLLRQLVMRVTAQCEWSFGMVAAEICRASFKIQWDLFVVCNASMEFSRAVLFIGWRPKKRPTTMEKKKATITTCARNDGGKPMRRARRRESAMPIRTPATPPIDERMIDSIKI